MFQVRNGQLEDDCAVHLHIDMMASDMLLVLVLVVVSVVSGNVNSTVEGGGSRMAWMKALLDHHDWVEPLSGGNLTLQHQCREDLGTYLAALNSGKLWASRSEYPYFNRLLFRSGQTFI